LLFSYAQTKTYSGPSLTLSFYNDSLSPTHGVVSIALHFLRRPFQSFSQPIHDMPHYAIF